MPRGDLFPLTEPHASGMLGVDDRHRIYWEESGNPEGMPVVFLHGGPGAGTVPAHRRFFDARRCRIILFDQRGAGRSTPSGDVTDNTLDRLIADMERLRVHLGIDKWALFGGSWGSTLALAYAQAHPERCLGLVLRGIFLFRQEELDWFLTGVGRVFPEAWRQFAEHIPLDERGDLLEAYWRRLDDRDPLVARVAARVWTRFEASCSTLLPNASAAGFGPAAEDRQLLALARIEAHFFRAGMPVPEDRLLRDVPRIRHLPCTIVHGRYDMVCPIASAYALHRAWPEAEFVVVPDAGHSSLEPGVREALVKAMDALVVRHGG